MKNENKKRGKIYLKNDFSENLNNKYILNTSISEFRKESIWSKEDTDKEKYRKKQRLSSFAIPFAAIKNFHEFEELEELETELEKAENKKKPITYEAEIVKNENFIKQLGEKVKQYKVNAIKQVVLRRVFVSVLPSGLIVYSDPPNLIENWDMTIFQHRLITFNYKWEKFQQGAFFLGGGNSLLSVKQLFCKDMKTFNIVDFSSIAQQEQEGEDQLVLSMKDFLLKHVKFFCRTTLNIIEKEDNGRFFLEFYLD